jgi:3'-phosphoadenosine 5'-phosphosulfate sulfotransferase (PAPS reductase)/FAD synthetase
MSDPFFITGPALISFSGGRTSAYMLWRILQAHSGTLPDDVHVVFANTGKEREETLRFVHECGSRWGVRIRWVEWTDRVGRQVPAADRFVEVGFNSASRKGEPLKALIRRKRYLPNAVTRFCTAEAKIDTMKQFMIAQDYGRWTNVVGLRHDEGHRLLKQYARNAAGKERWRSYMPLDKAKVTKRGHVMPFWLGENVDPRHLTHPLPQGFDLGLRDYEGNCDACMLKGFEVLAHQEREMPGYLDDWIEMEDIVTELGARPAGARFVTEYSYRQIKAHAQSPLLIPLDWRELPEIGECNTVCAGEAA